MPVFYAAFSRHVFRGALRDILINCVIDRKKEQITAPFRRAKNEIILYCVASSANRRATYSGI